MLVTVFQGLLPEKVREHDSLSLFLPAVSTGSEIFINRT